MSSSWQEIKSIIKRVDDDLTRSAIEIERSNNAEADKLQKRILFLAGYLGLSPDMSIGGSQDPKLRDLHRQSYGGWLYELGRTLESLEVMAKKKREQDAALTEEWDYIIRDDVKQLQELKKLIASAGAAYLDEGPRGYLDLKKRQKTLVNRASKIVETLGRDITNIDQKTYLAERLNQIYYDRGLVNLTERVEASWYDSTEQQLTELVDIYTTAILEALDEAKRQ